MKQGKKLHLFYVCRRILPIFYKTYPVMLTSVGILMLFHAVSLAAQTMFTKEFLDKAAMLAEGSVSWRPVLISFAFMGGMSILFQLLNGICNFMPEYMSFKVIAALRRMIFKKSASISPELYEDTDTLDAVNKAIEGSGSAVNMTFILSIIFVFYVPYFVFMGWYLFTLKPILLLSIVIVFIPTALTQIIRVKVFAKLEDDSAPLRREYDYLESCLVSREYFKETRLLGAFTFFRDMMRGVLKTTHKLQVKANVRTGLIELSMRLVTVGGYCAILFMLFTALMAGEISVGAFAAVFASIGQLYAVMDEIVCRHIGAIAKNAGSVANFIRFLDLPERKGSKPAPKWGDIELDNVGFSYPGAKKKALDNVSFTLKKCETLAVVGENGSGKSTLIRLITGMYPPTSGKILHNGIDTRDIKSDQIYNNVSAVFQKYQRYQMTLRENLTVSEPEKKAPDAALDDVCRDADIEKDGTSYPDKYDTMLSREFDGVDLSGGQWQRIAIARGLYRDHNLIILDEPTAAIDPYEETRVYNRFAEIARDKSAVIVTHRLGSVKLADRIVVMSNGKAVQIGTHDELMAAGGEYRRLWDSQEQWYRDSTDF